VMETVSTEKEVYLKVENNLIENFNEFQTDGNGLFNIKRRLNSKLSIDPDKYLIEDEIG